MTNTNHTAATLANPFQLEMTRSSVTISTGTYGTREAARSAWQAVSCLSANPANGYVIRDLASGKIIEAAW